MRHLNQQMEIRKSSELRQKSIMVQKKMLQISRMKKPNITINYTTKEEEGGEEQEIDFFL